MPWDDEEDIEAAELETEGNIYLRDATKGLELILDFLPQKNKETDQKQQIADSIDGIIDTELLDVLYDLGDERAVEWGKRLEDIGDRLIKYHRVNLLKGKSVIGIGGQFSAGKSCFINSLLGEDVVLLPEDQNATTSIPTYLLQGEKDKVFVHASGGAKRVLEKAAFDALTHKFFDRYKIGLAAYADNLVVYTPKFSFENIVLLDTPGYSKSEDQEGSGLTDEKIARKQLLGVDRLIWLVDAENGVLQERDMDFLADVSQDKPVLIVVNKADKKHPEDIKNIVEGIKSALSDSSLENIFGVAAYSARVPNREYPYKELVSEFFKTAENSPRLDERAILKEVDSQIREAFEQKIEQAKKEKRGFDKEIESVIDVRSVSALLRLRAVEEARVENLGSEKKRFEAGFRKIWSLLTDLNEVQR